MTYRDLLKELKKFSKEELDLDIAVKVGGDTYSGHEAVILLDEDGSEGLDEDHPFIFIS
jgi:hypothetical protein